SLCDKSGSVPVRHWDATDSDFICYKAANYLTVRGRVETYKNAMQMIVFAARTCEDQINAADFLPVSARPAEEMEREFNALLDSFTDPHYKALLNAIFADPSVRSRYLKGPAAASVHHAWIGGLLEH